MKLFKKAEAMAFPVLLFGSSLFFLTYEILRAAQKPRSRPSAFSQA